MIYTSDILTLGSLGTHLLGTNILIVDALHPRAEDIFSLCEDEIDRIILTHGLSGDLKKILKARKNCIFEIADEETEILL